MSAGLRRCATPGTSALAVVSRDEAATALERLTDEQMDDLGRRYRGDDWAFGKRIAWMYAEAIRLGWILGPA